MNSNYNGYSFPINDTVIRQKVSFYNRYGIMLAGDLYLPKVMPKQLAAVAIAGPFGTVKEQCAGLYAEDLDSRGFAALAFDPSFIGNFADKFAELNDGVLFGQVWSRETQLSLRDRSLVTVVALMSRGLVDESFRYHLMTAKKNGITRPEIAEILTHAAFYAG